LKNLTLIFDKISLPNCTFLFIKLKLKTFTLRILVKLHFVQ